MESKNLHPHNVNVTLLTCKRPVSSYWKGRGGGGGGLQDSRGGVKFYPYYNSVDGQSLSDAVGEAQ